MDIGFVWAFITILLFGSWAVPANGLNVPPRVQAFWLTVGHLLLSLIIYCIYGKSISLTESLVPLLMGGIWAIGITAGYASIKEIGITRAVGTWVPVLILLSTGWGLTVFGETPNLLLLACALLAVLVAAYCMILSSENEATVHNRFRGYLLAVVLAVCHGSYFVPLQNSNLPIQATLFPVAIGMVITMCVIISITRARIWYRSVPMLRMSLAGIILGGGNYVSFATMSALGVSLGYPLTQLGIVVNTLWGVLLFHEVTTRRGKLLVVCGVIAALIGALLANYART